ncbi:MAG: acetyl/propionyl-CoA carboxylase subunit alpha, partial [Sphingomonadaceae bacterium]|nr:acetyl/propionyl-CoA carboxylase subunit alpha [Sphingomonadaceae bacterium]
ERECSIQRRHQKVIEEAPSPFVTPEMRRAMGEQAVALAKAVGYYSAGTVELIVSGADTTGQGFYFLEMNTRLQVEHPVTECITGLDLVEQMIRVAAGEPLAFTQGDVKLDGWAIESRVYAEDPYRNFLPSIGRLTRYSAPEETSGETTVRVDTGVVEGSEISMFYDPMIAKLITHAPTREGAADLQVAALDRYRIDGIGHNIDFLSAVMQHQRFRDGRLTTGFIAEEYPDGFEGAPFTDGKRDDLIIAAAVINAITVQRAQFIEGQLNGHGAQFGADWVIEIDRKPFSVRAEETSSGWTVTHTFEGGAHAHNVATEWVPGDPVFLADVDGRSVAVKLAQKAVGYRMTVKGSGHDVRALTPRASALAGHMIEKIPPDLSKFLLCPMPGLVVSVAVAAGDKVEPGQALAVVEAMKMENILRAEKASVVKSVNAKAGDSLAVDPVIMEFE